MRKIHLSLIFFSIFQLSIVNCQLSILHAQVTTPLVSNIKTLQVKLNGEWGEPPVMIYGGSNFIEISFDDLQHNFVRYEYNIIHCNADWTESELIPSEYMDGFNGQRIEDYIVSMNTTMEYNHYSFRIPNNDVQLKLPGNYRVDIINDDNDDELVAQAFFSILEPRVSIRMEVSGNTDIDTWNSHQQVDFTVNYLGYHVQNPIEDFYPVIMQNRRWDNCVTDIRPTYMRNGELVYTHNKQLIFEGGNEYRRFEILDEYVPTMRVFSMSYHAPYYHATLFDDNRRLRYLFDKDQDGRYWIRNGKNVENESESDYFYTHFRLVTPPIAGGDVYLNGDLTYGLLTEDNRMTYNAIDHCYEIMKPLKQGSYNYQYLFLYDGETAGTTVPVEGSFHQTENEYWIYIYNRPFGERSDKLVGFQKYTHNLSK